MATELAFLSTKVKDLETLAKEMLCYVPPTGVYRRLKGALEDITVRKPELDKEIGENDNLVTPANTLKLLCNIKGQRDGLASVFNYLLWELDSGRSVDPAVIREKIKPFI